MIRLFNSGCLEALKGFDNNQFDLAIVDPEYQNNDAIGIKNGSKHSAKRKDYKIFKNIAPDKEYFIELKRVSKNQIIWGGNYFGLKGGVIAWNKYGTAFGEGEIAICSTHNSVRFFNYVWNGMLQGDMKNKEHRIHVTQKPVALYKWLLKNYGFNKDGSKRTILDTHFGSLSIGIACADMGFDLTAYEIDSDYFNSAVKRLDNHVRQSNMFVKRPEINIYK